MSLPTDITNAQATWELEQYRNLLDFVREFHDADDVAEARLKADSIVGIVNEVMARREQRAAERMDGIEQAERMDEPPDAGWVVDFNAGGIR